ncbi:MAG: hypothetical protein KDA31_08125 [Phycisphaerales bacterium]|nr:hypothetical protein [Phycisphaerales bacterium]MCB9835876.1 hypothetical protein [Phycisphaera sp.]
MKEDILEQLVDDYLQSRGYFTIHNIKFLPRKDHPDFIKLQDSNHSDIDVLGYNPRRDGTDRVLAVSCKSWQTGFPVRAILDEIENNKRRSGKETWRSFRELVRPKWSEAFIAAIEAATGSSQFTYITAVTVIKGDRSDWESHKRFQTALNGNPIRLLSLGDMVSEVTPLLGTTLASSQFGRTIQLLKASGYTLST